MANLKEKILQSLKSGKQVLNSLNTLSKSNGLSSHLLMLLVISFQLVSSTLIIISFNPHFFWYYILMKITYIL